MSKANWKRGHSFIRFHWSIMIHPFYSSKNLDVKLQRFLFFCVFFPMAFVNALHFFGGQGRVELQRFGGVMWDDLGLEDFRKGHEIRIDSIKNHHVQIGWWSRYILKCFFSFYDNSYFLTSWNLRQMNQFWTSHNLTTDQFCEDRCPDAASGQFRLRYKTFIESHLGTHKPWKKIHDDLWCFFLPTVGYFHHISTVWRFRL